MKNLKIRSSILRPENLSEKFKNIENEIFFTFLKNPFSFFVENLVTQKWNFHFRFNKNRDFLTTPDYDKYLKKDFKKWLKIGTSLCYMAFELQNDLVLVD